MNEKTIDKIVSLIMTAILSSIQIFVVATATPDNVSFAGSLAISSVILFWLHATKEHQ